jgi:ubiquinone/menaquinone biosynthesis C-methylase UbiE
MADPREAGNRCETYGGAHGALDRVEATHGEAAALATIEALVHAGSRQDRRAEVTTDEVTHARAATDVDRELKAATRAMWALGDYHRFASELVWELGPVLVRACGISAGQRVLDVAAGSGNVAIRAAEAGAQVVACDLAPENFEAGRREARARGVALDWVEGDAEALPFGDGEFDVVTSSLGAMFAPNHRKVADELVRVCRPGGTIGMVNFTPEGLAADFFGVFAPHMPPPPPGALPPVMWGSEGHVRELLGDRVLSLEMLRREYAERAASPRSYCELFKETFGPVVAVYTSLADQPERVAELDHEFLEFAVRANRGAPDGPAEYHYEYLLVVAREKTQPLRS